MSDRDDDPAGRKNGGRTSGLKALLYCALIALCLTPFLFGGVLSGDSHEVLRGSQDFAASQMTLPQFLRTEHGSYLWHHMLWFGITYASLQLVQIVTQASLWVQALLSAEAIFFAITGAALCVVALVRRMQFDRESSAAAVLGTFTGGYGVFVITMGGTVESLMVPAMAIRLFLFEGAITPLSAVLLGLTDIALVAFKPYSLAVIAFTWPLVWARASRRGRLAYGATFGLLMAGFALFKLWTWNPTPDYGRGSANAGSVLFNLFQQIASPWSGLIFCMPVVLALFWMAPERRRALWFKSAGLVACMLILSLFPFFDGDVPGGRYIFPFLLILLPEITSGISNLVRKLPRAAWLLPLFVAAFLPTALYSLPFFPNNELSGVSGCQRVHPVLYAWRMVIAQATGAPRVSVCYHTKRYVLETRDATSPRTAPWRVAYFISGAHSPHYVDQIHGKSPEQQQHDAWGNMLSQRLARFGLGEAWIWRLLGSLPAIAALWFAVVLALRINRRAPSTQA